MRNNAKLFYFCLMLSSCFLFTAPLMAKYPDLAGHWNFNSSTLDLSGNDNNGIITGTAAYTGGITGKAFDFNGSTSIDCGVSSSLSIADNISIELWFYPKQWVSGYAAYPIAKRNTTSDANYVMYFFGDTAGGNYKKIAFYANVGGAWRDVSPACLIPSLNTWYHIVWTYNSMSGGKLYVNGVQYGSAVASGTLATNTASVVLGKYTTNPGVTGIIDELKIYNTVLTAADVLQKNQDAQTKGYWNLHGNTLDFSGNDNHGTVSGTATYNSSGKVGKAFDFDGNTSIDCGNDSSVNIVDNISIELWFYPKQWVTASSVHPISKWTSSTNANYVMYFFGPGNMDKRIAFYANAGGTWKNVSSSYVIPALNTWYHIVWTYNSVTGGQLYVNGTPYGSSIGTGALATNTANLKLGKYSTNPGFNGLIDEITIYNRVLSAADVTARYQDLGVAGAVLENDTLKLTVNSAGKIPELLVKSIPANYSGGTVDFAKLKKAGVWYSPSSCLQKNGRLLFDFGSANVAVEATTKTCGSYFVFQIHSVYGDTAGIEELRLFNVTPPYTYYDFMSGIRANDTFTIALRPMNARSAMASSYPLQGEVFPYFGHGLELAKFCLLGYSTGGIRDAFKTMLTAEGLPRSSIGGPWALDAIENTYSYIFVFDVSPSNVSQYISLAQNAGSKIINFYNWWTSTGHYAPKTSQFPNGLNDLKGCVDAIHAAGLKASMHCLTGLISTNDSYVTPLADARLLKDAQFTLSSAIGIADTTIYVNEQPSPTLSTTGKVLQIGNELITYTDYTQTVPYRFNGCTRGAYSTTKQTQAAGASAGHLRQAYSAYFFPDPDSTLVNEMAVSLANVVNYCGFDMIYLDAAEAMLTSYERFKMGAAIFNRIGKAVRVESSSADQNYWTFYSNVGAWDYPLYGTKKFIDKHVQNVADYCKTRFMPCQLGWWYFLGFSADYYSQLPDEVEYLCAKALGSDAALSHESILPSPVNARQDEYLQMVKAYEDLRAAGSVSAAAKAQLKTAGSEFHLTPTGNITERDNLAHKITSLSDGSNLWTVNNRFSSQPAKFRIQALHSDLTASYDNSPNIVLDDFQDAGNFVLTNASNVTSSLSVNGGICTYAATNNSATPVGAWTKASKTFSTALNISGGYDTLGVWVNGDNRGEVLNFQLYQSSPYTIYDDHYVVVNFTGWKYFELFLRERDADKFESYLWPYSGSSYSNVYRTALARNSISNLNIYYNNLPVGQQASCQIKPVKALVTESVSITNPGININGTQITFPVTLQSGQYIEFNSISDCKHYDVDGAFIANVTPTGSAPTMGAGNNSVTFNGSGTAGYNARANVTMFIDGAQIYP